jgi:hypothetical protein
MSFGRDVLLRNLRPARFRERLFAKLMTVLLPRKSESTQEGIQQLRHLVGAITPFMLLNEPKILHCPMHDIPYRLVWHHVIEFLSAMFSLSIADR